MEQSNSNNSLEFNGKHKSRLPFTENGANREGGPHCSSVGSGSWYDGHRDHRREHGKKRDRSHDKEWNRDGVVHGRATDTFRDDESRDRFREEQPTFPSYGYTSTPDASYVDNNRRALGMMSNLQTYGLIPAMNSSQWTMNPLDGMNMNSGGMNVNQSTGMNMTPNMEMNPNSATGINPFAFMGIPGDPNLFGMMGMGNIGQFGMMGMGNFGQFGMMGGDSNVMIGPGKEIIHLTSCVLYPQSPTLPPPTTRQKPLGCKTVFVGGLPESTTEKIVKEIFEKCGEILTIQMSKKNFCHIRFSSEGYVENAIYLSGYRIKIENKDDAPFSGRLHVDYAQAHDDQYEYECLQRSLQREARHREHLEQEYLRPPTPPPVVHYSDHEADILGDKLRGEETFQKALFILITWLERGECNKRNAGFFYSMIQSTNSHVRRLLNEKLKYEDELNKAKMMLKQQMQRILLQFNEIGKVFGAASMPKAWDHFTKPQRKNIELWKKQTEEIKNAHVEEVLNDRIEDEMDVSDDDNDSLTKKSENEGPTVTDQFGNKVDALEEINKLREENDSVRCQLEASQNEIVLLRSESEHDRDLRERQIIGMHQAIQGFQKELLNLTQKRSKDEAELKELRSFKMKRKDTKLEKDISETSHDRDDDTGLALKDFTENDNEIEVSSIVSSSSSKTLSVTEVEARLIGLISTFLNVHPFGASVDYICSYLHQIDCIYRARDVETLMKKFPTVFKEESIGIGASLEKKWNFRGFKSQI